jgi:hypothetical protein
MIGELTEYFCYVPEAPGGWEWQPVPGKTDVWRLVAKPGTKFCRQNILRGCPALYRIFADTEPSLKGLLEFANQYGLLWRSNLEVPDAQTVVVASKAVSEQNGRVVETQGVVDEYLLWRLQLFMVRECVRLWDLVRHGSYAELLKSFPRQQGRYRYKPFPRDLKLYAVPEDFLWVALRGIVLGSKALLDSDDVTKHAYLWVVERSAQLLTGTISLALSWDHRGRAVHLTCQPHSLIGAIGLQLALAIQNATPAKRCEGCGRWFELAPGKNRPDRTTCSQTCRNRLYLHRQKEARELHAAGKTPRQIAKVLASDEQTVKRWLSRAED